MRLSVLRSDEPPTARKGPPTFPGCQKARDLFLSITLVSRRQGPLFTAGDHLQQQGTKPIAERSHSWANLIHSLFQCTTHYLLGVVHEASSEHPVHVIR